MLRFRDGKYLLFNLAFYRLQMLEQLGLVPTPAGANLERARSLYRDRLGMEPIEERTGGLRFALN